MINEKSDDHLLLDSIKDGHHRAFDILVERHHLMFYRVAYRLLNNREEAEDIVQDAFLKLWENPALWDGSRNNKFTTWFYRVVVNLCYDRQRKKKPLPLADDYDAPDHAMPIDQIIEDEQESSAVHASIKKLPERQKQALVLCFFEELSNKDAAKIMNVSTRALQSLLMRAKENLKIAMQREEGGVS